MRAVHAHGKSDILRVFILSYLIGYLINNILQRWYTLPTILIIFRCTSEKQFSATKAIAVRLDHRKLPYCVRLNGEGSREPVWVLSLIPDFDGL